MTPLGARRAVAVFLVFAFAYFLSALVRAITATLSPDLVAEFGLSAQQLGLLAGGYFLGFSLTQLPLGHWLDRHGPRTVILGFLVVAVVGCVAFGAAGNFASLLAARVFIGVGVSACLMAPLTGYRRWFTPQVQLRTNAWMLMTGSLGMVASTLPVQWLLPLMGWRPLFGALAGLIVLAMALIAWQVPRWQAGGRRAAPSVAASPGAAAVPQPLSAGLEPTPGPGRQPEAGAADDDSGRTGYAQIGRSAYFWRLAPIGFFSYGGFVAIQTLWAGPWMTQVNGLDRQAAATGLFTINLSMLATFWLWGMVTPRLARAGWGADRLIAWGLPLSLVILLGIVLAGPAAGAAAWAAFCVASSAASLAQPAVGMAFPPALAGRALSAYNLVIFAGVFCVQWGIGGAIDALVARGWAIADAHRGAMALFGLSSLLSWLWFIAAGRIPARSPQAS